MKFQLITVDRPIVAVRDVTVWLFYNDDLIFFCAVVAVAVNGYRFFSKFRFFLFQFFKNNVTIFFFLHSIQFHGMQTLFFHTAKHLFRQAALFFLLESETKNQQTKWSFNL